MSSNDGKQLLVFGLSFAQHDNRKMQQLLRHYNKLPDNPGSRANLFVQLNKVAKELMADEAAQGQITQLTDWMTKGGDFPLGLTPAPTPANSRDQVRPAQGSGTASRPSLPLGIPHFLGRHGPGRTLSGQPIPTNQAGPPAAPYLPPLAASRRGINYGRGRTVNGDWDGNQEAELAEGDDNEEDADGMIADEDDEMQDHVDPFLFRPRPRQHVGLQWQTAFSGPGRTLNDPQEEPSATAAVDELEDGATGSTRAEGQGIHDEHINDEDLSEDSEILETMERWENSLIEMENSLSESEGQPDDGQEIECPICLEDYPRSKFPKRPTITRFCDHPDKACLNCLDSSITAIIERGALHLLACPICPQRLSPRNIREYANPEVYKRYKYLKEQSEIPGHYISCTNPVCGGSQPHESDDPMMVCNHCQFATCANHRRPWHEGQTCKEFDLDDAQIERLEEEEATAKLLSRESLSICPKCGQGVTKSDGCDHMRCQCGKEWCYVVSKSCHLILKCFFTYHRMINSAPARSRTYFALDQARMRHSAPTTPTRSTLPSHSRMPRAAA